MNTPSDISPANQPFYTTNAILSFCLWRAGVPFWEPTQPCLNIYNLDIIRKFLDARGEPVFKGWELEKAIKEAHRRGLRGKIIYVFRQTIRLRDLCQAFREQETILSREDITVESIVKDVVSAWFDGKIESDDALLRLACVDLKTRVEFMELWQKQVPMMEVANEGEVEQHEEMIQTRDGPTLAKVFDHPGFKIMSINASKETREHLGL